MFSYILHDSLQAKSLIRDGLRRSFKRLLDTFINRPYSHKSLYQGTGTTQQLEAPITAVLINAE